MKSTPFPPATNQIQAGTAQNGLNGIASCPADNANGPAAPVEDRYSALKDLDALFTTQNEPTNNWAPAWNSGPSQVALPNKPEANFGNNLEPASAWNGAFPTSSNPFLGNIANAFFFLFNI